MATSQTLLIATTRELEAEGARLVSALGATGTRSSLVEDSLENARAALEALTEELVHIAVLRGRSCTDLPDDVQVAAVLRREEPRDVLIPSREVPLTLPTLPRGARVGAAGARRRGFLLAHRRDVEPVLPGNGAGPAGALRSGSVDAVILGAAQARRLGLARRVSEILDAKAWVPGPAQGATALVVRTDDQGAVDACRTVDDPASHVAFRAELSTLDSQGGGPDLPLGALAMPHGPWVRMWGMLASADGTRVVRGDLTGRTRDPEGAGRALGELLLARGGASLLGEGTP